MGLLAAAKAERKAKAKARASGADGEPQESEEEWADADEGDDSDAGMEEPELTDGSETGAGGPALGGGGAAATHRQRSWCRLIALPVPREPCARAPCWHRCAHLHHRARPPGAALRPADASEGAAADPYAMPKSPGERKARRSGSGRAAAAAARTALAAGVRKVGARRAGSPTQQRRPVELLGWSSGRMRSAAACRMTHAGWCLAAAA